MYYGFGFPLLEAMSYGLPVITSNISAMPEVAGDAALYVNPYNRREISRAVLELLKNRKLRETLSQKSVDRCKMFSWKSTAEKTISVYEETVS